MKHPAAWLYGLCVVAVLGRASVCARPWPVKHPVTKFSARHVTPLKRIRALDSDGLRKLYADAPRGYLKMAVTFERGAEAAVAKWQQEGDKEYRDIAVRAYQAAVSDLDDASDAELCVKVSDRGSIDPQNLRMRDACYHFALLYYLTGQESYAHKSAVLLQRFAGQVPKWPLYNPYYKEPKKAFSQTDPRAFEDEYCAGFWGTWLHSDCLLGIPVARAYDLIYNTGEMQELGAVAAVEGMLRSHVDLQFRFIMFSNMDGSQLQGILAFEEILGEPEWIHKCVWWIKGLYKTQFYADGWWHEGTASYHNQLHYRLQRMARERLQGYSDPPGFISKLDGTRFDNLDVLKTFGGGIRRGDNAVRGVMQPNGIYQVIHDTGFPDRVWGAPPMQEARSVLHGCMGHAILGTGKGKGNLVQATLHFSGIHGHSHLDCLNLILFAKGKELISETRYRPQGVKNTTREWHTMTAGHVTTVIDEKSQDYRGVRTREPEDAVPGYPDWPWRWRGHGCRMTDGKLRLFNTDFDMVQVAEADGERAYNATLKDGHYRRTIALVKISDSDVYVVDVFRVKGGKVHDYMLHSCLGFPHELELSQPLKTKREGKLHKYIGDLRSAKTDGSWTATFTLKDKSAALKTFFLPQKGTEIIQGQAPAMRRQGTAPFIAVRQSDGDSILVAVHHPYVAKPLVQKVERIPLRPAGGRAVAIRVTLPGRVDTIISTMDEKPWKLRKTGDGKIKLRGRFAHVAEGEGVKNWAYLVDGDLLVAGDKEIHGKVSHRGIIEGTRRVEAGDAFDAFITESKLPTDGSLNERTLMVDEGGLLVQSFRIKEIERRGKWALIHSHDEPGMTIKGNLVKLEYFPNWGIRGEARFRIAGSALLRATDAGEWRFTASGDASATVGGKRIGP